VPVAFRSACVHVDAFVDEKLRGFQGAANGRNPECRTAVFVARRNLETIFDGFLHGSQIIFFDVTEYSSSQRMMTGGTVCCT